MRLLFTILLLSNICFAQTRKPIILPLGSDMSANIKYTISDVNAKVIEIERPGGGDIKVQGALDFKGKVLRLGNGTKIIGANPITNAIIDAGYEQQIFSSNAKIINVRTSGYLVSVKWFGAKGDGVTDDYLAIQATIDATISNNGLPRDVYFPQGAYRISQPIIAYKLVNGKYETFSVNLIGQSESHFNNMEPCARIIPTFTDKFAIGYQRGRSSVIRGISIEGAANVSPPVSDYEYYNRPAEGFSNGRDSRYSPYAGIVIDPFNVDGTLPPDGGYPGMANWYTQSHVDNNTAGSSAINIEQCRVTGFTVGIIYSPNGGTQQAENCLVEKMSIENCTVAYAYCQRQSKNNFIRNSIHWDRIHTVIDGVTYGARQGQPPYVDGLNIAGNVIQLFNVVCQFPTTFDNIFSERLFSIGRVESFVGKVSIRNSNLEFLAASFYPEFHFKGSGVVFEECTMRYYDDLFDKRLHINGVGIQFNNCYFDRLPYFPPKTKQRQIVKYINCRSGNDGSIIIGHTGGENNEEVSGEGIVLHGSFRLKSTSGLIIDYNTGDEQIYFPATNNHPIITANGDGTGQSIFDGQAHYLLPGDYLYAGLKIRTNEPYKYIGRIKTIDYISGAVTLDCMPVSSNTDQYYGVYSSLYKTHDWPVIGDIKDNYTVTNVKAFTNMPGVDHRYFINGNPCRVTSVGQGIFTLSYVPVKGTFVFGAYYSDFIINNQIYQPTSTQAKEYTRVIPKRARYIVGDIEGNNYEEWICTRGGYIKEAQFTLKPY